ncbi:hypothetical protein ACLI1A_04955 [Flavobacterium sp. RHBU_3]|uniref:hypothetical protein n=1 Tax=Flavobacterium sp. RHBU_3 TaxID=3391184 RepID=UPI00398568EA
MKKNTKKILKVISVIIGGLGLIYLILLFINVGFCWKDYNKAYYEWLPYSKDDIILFSNGKTDQQYKVTEVHKYHTESYRRFCKCGYCDDTFMATLTGDSNVINIIVRNYDNPDSNEQAEIEVIIDKDYYTSDTVFPESGKQLISKHILLKKAEGLTRFSYKGKVWQLKQHTKKGTEPEIESI